MPPLAATRDIPSQLTGMIHNKSTAQQSTKLQECSIHQHESKTTANHCHPTSPNNDRRNKSAAITRSKLQEWIGHCKLRVQKLAASQCHHAIQIAGVDQPPSSSPKSTVNCHKSKIVCCHAIGNAGVDRLRHRMPSKRLKLQEWIASISSHPARAPWP